MPSQSRAMHNLMEARAHGATFPMARKVPVSVAREFVMADVGRKFSPASVKKGKRK